MVIIKISYRVNVGFSRLSMLILFILIRENKDIVKNEVQNCFKIFKNPIIQNFKVKKITKQIVFKSFWLFYLGGKPFYY